MALTAEEAAELAELDARAAANQSSAAPTPPTPVAAPTMVPQPTALPSPAADAMSMTFTPAGAPPEPPPVPAPAQAPITPGSQEAAAASRPGVLETLWETTAATGARKANPDYEKLPDWIRMPELWNLSKPAMLALAGTVASGPDETEKILKEQFPGLGIKKDGRYLIFKSGDGNEYAWKPGVRWSDLARTGALVAGTGAAAAAGTAALPAVAAALPGGVMGGALAGAGGAAVTEGLQAAAGGDFNPDQVALGAAFGTAPRVLGKVFGKAEPAASEAAGLGSTMAKAARGDAAAAAEYAAQVKPDAATMAAAKRMDVLQHLDPDHVSTSAAVQELSQAVKVAARSTADVDAAARIGERMQQYVAGSGGALDRNALSGLIAEAEGLVERSYGAVDKVLPKTAPTPATSLLAAIDEEVAGQGGMSQALPWLKKLRARAASADGADPQWGRVDSIRKDLGLAMRGRGSYSKAEPGLASKLYKAADADQLATADRLNVGETYRTAQAAVKAQKAFEAEAAARLGMQAGTLSRANAERFVKAVTDSPAEMRPKLAASALLSTFMKDGTADLAGFVKWHDSFKESSAAYNALMTSLPAETRAGLQDAYRVASSFVNATSKRGLVGRLNTVLPDPKEAAGFAQKLFGLVVDNTAGRALNAAGVPSPAGGFTNFLLAKISGADTPIVEALETFIKSPAGRAAIEASASAAPVKPGLISSVAASPQFQKLWATTQKSASAAKPWLESAFRMGAQSGQTFKAEEQQQ